MDKEKLKERNRLAKQKERERKRALGIPVNSEKDKARSKNYYKSLAEKGLTRVTMDIRTIDQVQFEFFCVNNKLTYAQAFEKLMEVIKKADENGNPVFYVDTSEFYVNQDLKI